MSQPFENVREQLLRAGIAPRNARRFVTELREHLADLAAQGRASGLNDTDAQERATALMGSDAQLVRAVLDAGAPRSLAVRAPWWVFALLPVLLLLAVIMATGNSMMQVLWPVRGLSLAEMSTAYAGIIWAAIIFTSYLIGPLLAAGCIVVALRQRLASHWVWIGLALVALVSGPLGFHMNHVPAASGDGGRTIFSAVGFVYQQGRPDLAATLSVAALRAAALFGIAVVALRVLQNRLADQRRA